MKRYIIERVANKPAMRKIKDTKRNKYIKQPHGQQEWEEQAARLKCYELNTQITENNIKI